jgi:hypothetical protein
MRTQAIAPSVGGCIVGPLRCGRENSLHNLNRRLRAGRKRPSSVAEPKQQSSLNHNAAGPTTQLRARARLMRAGVS